MSRRHCRPRGREQMPSEVANRRGWCSHAIPTRLVPRDGRSVSLSPSREFARPVPDTLERNARVATESERQEQFPEPLKGQAPSFQLSPRALRGLVPPGFRISAVGDSPGSER
jgi:hypothetical protein